MTTEFDLTNQIKKVHKMSDKLPADDFKDRYNDKVTDAVRYATTTIDNKEEELLKNNESCTN